MIIGNRSFMVGMKRDPVFGPVVASAWAVFYGGSGMWSCPGTLDEQDAAELPKLIKAKRCSARSGYPPVDHAALQDQSRPSGRCVDHPEIAEIDVNTVSSRATRHRADALVILGQRLRREAG